MISKQDSPQKESQKGEKRGKFRAVPCVCTARARRRAWVCRSPRPRRRCSLLVRVVDQDSGEVGAADAGARAAPAAAAALPADEHRPAGAPTSPRLPFAPGGRHEDDHGEERQERDGDAEHDVAATDGRAGVGLEHHAAAAHVERSAAHSLFLSLPCLGLSENSCWSLLGAERTR